MLLLLLIKEIIAFRQASSPYNYRANIRAKRLPHAGGLFRRSNTKACLSEVCSILVRRQKADQPCNQRGCPKSHDVFQSGPDILLRCTGYIYAANRETFAVSHGWMRSCLYAHE